MSATENETNNKRVQELEAKIADLKRRWPAHSIPPTLMQELDDLEEELAEALAQAQQEEGNA
jgi:hypothetical protein